MYTLRRATAADNTFLYDLHAATMKPYVAQVWGWDERSQAERFRQRFSPSRLRIVVAEEPEIGVLEVEDRPSDLFLANLRISPAFHRRGWGSRILPRPPMSSPGCRRASDAASSQNQPCGASALRAAGLSRRRGNADPLSDEY
jgi:hypothetical protein